MNKGEIEIIIKGVISPECMTLLKYEAQKQMSEYENIEKTITSGIPIKEYIKIYKNYLNNQKDKNNLDKYIKQIEPIKLWEMDTNPKTINEYIEFLNKIIDNIEKEISYLSSVLDVLSNPHNKNDYKNI